MTGAVIMSAFVILLGVIAFVAKAEAEGRQKREQESEELMGPIRELDQQRLAFLQRAHSDSIYDDIDRYYHTPELSALVESMVEGVLDRREGQLVGGVDLLANLLHAVDGRVKDYVGSTKEPRLWPVTVRVQTLPRAWEDRTLSLTQDEELALAQLWQDTLRKGGVDVRLGWNSLPELPSDTDTYRPHIVCHWLGCETGTAKPVPTSVETVPSEPAEEILALRSRLHDALEACKSRRRVETIVHQPWNKWQHEAQQHADPSFSQPTTTQIDSRDISDIKKR